MLIDTHAHLNFSDYQNDLDKIIKRSLKADVKKIICVSSNLADCRQAIIISQKYPKIVWAAVGLHPQQTDPKNKTSPKEQIETLKKLAREKNVVAIGECGLDYSPASPEEKDRSKKEQLFLFQEQVKISQELKLPLIIHSRQAFQETLEVLRKAGENKDNEKNKNNKKIKGIFHCYSAGKKGIEKVNQLGFYFGLDGNLTYDVGLQNTFIHIPLEKILLETDSPFLTPIPFRGQRNEPAKIKIIAEFLAKLKKTSLKKVSQATSQNGENLFKV